MSESIALPADASRDRHPGARRAAPPGARPATCTAWITVVAVSVLPAIVAVELIGSIPGWLWVAQIGAAIALLALSLAWRRLRRLWRFAITMAALLLVIHVTPVIDLTWMPVQSVFGGSVFDARMQSEQAVKLLLAISMIGVLLLLGLRRRDFFLTRGDLTAPIRPVRLLGFPRADSWLRFGLIWGIGIAAALALAQYLIVRPTADELRMLVPMLPAVIVAAALNAFSEEMTYRAPMIATLEPALGSTQALAQSAVFFGVAHYFGTPGGLPGAALAIFMGWILGKAMIETRGLLWPWFIHFLSDVAIFSFLAMTLLR